MAVAASDGNFGPRQTLTMGHNTNIFALGLKDWALFDVQLEKSMHAAGANGFVTTPADAFKLCAKFQPVCVFPIISPVLGVHTRKYPRRQHWRRIACAFLIGEIGDHDRMLCLYI